MAVQLVSGGTKTLEQIALAVRMLRIPQQYHRPISERWQQMGGPPLSKLAPYTAHVVTVEVFFQIALAAHLISSERNSNRTDIAYLFYLPFCQVFVSSDKLHKSVANVFLRPDQEFVWGQDLKADLTKINAHFLQMPEAERDAGIMRFADFPPIEGASLVAEAWTRQGFRSRTHHENLAAKMTPAGEKRIVAEFKAFTKGKTTAPVQIPADGDDTVSVERRIAKKKGS